MYEVIGYKTKDGETIRVELEQTNTIEQALVMADKWLNMVSVNTWTIQVEQVNL